MTETTPITINGQQAAVLFTALELAILDVRDVLARESKASKPFEGALKLQLSSYEAEKARLAASFPVLVNGNAQPT